MRRALVVGATGLLGSAVTRRLLDDGWQVTATARSQTAIHWASDALIGADIEVMDDLLDGAAVDAVIQRARPNVLVNAVGLLGASGRDAVRDLMDTNLAITGVLLDACSRIGVNRVIQLGSGFEYAPADVPLDESAPVGPTTLYGASKVAATALARYVRDQVGLDVCIVRPFSLYGPREHLHRFVPYAVTRALAGLPIEMSSGTQIRDYLYIDDLAAAVSLAAGHRERLPPSMNLSGPARHSLETVAREIAAVAEPSVAIDLGARAPNPSDRPVFVGDSALACETLGWHPAHDLAAGLRRTIEWYRSHRSLWDVSR